MAGNENSGRIPTFHLSEKELSAKIELYKEGLESGEFAREFYTVAQEASFRLSAVKHSSRRAAL